MEVSVWFTYEGHTGANSLVSCWSLYTALSDIECLRRYIIYRQGWGCVCTLITNEIRKLQAQGWNHMKCRLKRDAQYDWRRDLKKQQQNRSTFSGMIRYDPHMVTKQLVGMLWAQTRLNISNRTRSIQYKSVYKYPIDPESVKPIDRVKYNLNYL